MHCALPQYCNQVRFCQIYVENKFIIFRIKGVLPFAFFNVVLSSLDVSSDLATYYSLTTNNPRWARLTLTWMFAPFCVHTAFYLVKKARGRCKSCTNCRELFVEFFQEAGVHLPLTLMKIELLDTTYCEI